ncbi:hypothetical protein BDZ89DRAFT_1063409 [Hymenopellis radicata]|nr:hypothetical protein BDZ89DRAFT_1063409 [Hymenopellis radicata]
MAPLETGTYSITNAGFKNSAELDGNYGTPVTCNAYTDRDSFKAPPTKSTAATKPRSMQRLLRAHKTRSGLSRGLIPERTRSVLSGR